MVTDRIVCRWDDRFGVEAGWYCEVWGDGHFMYDSQKVWFGVDVALYGRENWGYLRDALTIHYPDAEIVFRV